MREKKRIREAQLRSAAPRAVGLMVVVWDHCWQRMLCVQLSVIEILRRPALRPAVGTEQTCCPIDWRCTQFVDDGASTAFPGVAVIPSFGYTRNEPRHSENDIVGAWRGPWYYYFLMLLKEIGYEYRRGARIPDRYETIMRINLAQRFFHDSPWWTTGGSR